MRDKLIEIIKHFLGGCELKDVTPPYGFENLADHLIANGVTVQQWIPVSERLPEKDGDYMVCKTLKRYDGNPCYIRTIATFSHCLEKMDEHDLAGLKRPGWCKYDSEYGYYESTDITHWMPLPEAPKEGE